MPDPSYARSSDQAPSLPPQTYSAYPRFARDAPAGNAYAQAGYATPTQAVQQRSPLIHPNRSPQQRRHHHHNQIAPDPFPSYHSFNQYAQEAAWYWTQPVDSAQLPTLCEAKGELILELVDPLAPPLRPLPQRPAASPTMKRKSDAQRELEVLQHVVDVGSPAKRRAVSRTSSTTSQSPAHAGLADAQSSPIANGAQIGRVKSTSKGTGPQGIGIDISEQRRVVESSSSVDMLPAGRVFPIQIGSALFRLSGASLCSDAPSYFSHFFSEQLQSAAGRATDMKTLYIDRDPDTFRDIALHLQGYHIVPQNGEHFVKLFADAHFYSLPRLTKQLFKSDIFIDIGGTPFRIPRDSFSAPGNSPNYFSLGFAQWFSTPLEVFPGLDRSALLRPPSISPPSVPNRSGDVFGELMRMLQGYEVEIRSETHRANLLRDARYFHLKGLEQKLINCAMSWNADRGQNEILIRLEDIRQSGVGFLPDARNAAEHVEQSIAGGSVTYARPYTDDAGAINHLVLETSSTESASLALQPASLGAASAHVTVSFHGDALRRITSLLAIVAAKMGLLSTQALAPPRAAIPVRIDGNTSLSLDGKDVDLASNAVQRQPEVQWTVIRAHWRIRVEPTGTVDGYGDEHGGERLVAVLEAVKVDAFTNERRRNTARAFLTA